MREDERSLSLAGDTSYAEELMLEGAVDGVSSNERVSRETLKRVLRYAEVTPTVYLPGHDPESGRRLAERKIVEVRAGEQWAG